MTPYTRELYGQRSFVSANYAYSVPVSAGYRSLSCPTTIVKGNFTNPNEWSYSVLNNVYAKGLVQSYVNGVLVETVSGSMWQEAVAFADTSTLVSIAYNEALERLSEKARGNLDLATSLAEGKQTLKMINLSERLTANLRSMESKWKSSFYERLRTIRSRRALWRALKSWEAGHVRTLPLARKYYRKARINEGFMQRVSRLGANGWLEFTYGWSPLMGDIYGIATNLVGRVHGLSNRFRASSKQVVNQTRAEPATESYPPTRETATGSVTVRVMANMSGSFDPGMAAWTSMNPLSVAYELLPYSFVVDWVFNIGQYLRNLETSMLFRTQYQYGYISTLVAVDYEYSEMGRTLGSNSWYVSNVTAKKQVISFNRSLSVSYPIPDVPKLNLNLGSERLLSAASLLRQLLK